MKQSRTRPGVIMQFDKKMNTAVIVLDDPFSGQVGNIINNVPCPEIMGVQMVAPSPGTRCLVGFRDDNENNPYIVTYFTDPGKISGYSSNYFASTGIPKFMSR